MSSFHIRPRFHQVVESPPETFRERLVTQLRQEEDRFEIKSFPDFVCLRIHERERHFWSPRLNLSLEPGEEGKTIIHGIYGPNANVWSLMLFSYLIVGFLGIIAGVIAVSQWMIDSGQTWGLWLLGIAVAGLVALYLIAQVGQKLGAQQTFLLHQTYEAAVGRRVEIH